MSLAAACTYSVSPLRTVGGPDADARPDDDAGIIVECGDTSENPQSCGACGHDCLGQPCSSGACKPAVLAANQDEPRVLAADERAVYWGGAGGDAGISACLDKACTRGPQKIADETSPVIALASTKNYVFWATRGSVGRYPKDVAVDDGGAGYVDNGAVQSAVALAADDTFFYFTFVSGDNRGGVARCPIDGCDPDGGADSLAYDFDRPAGLGLGPAGFAFAAGLDSRSIFYCSPRCEDPPANRARIVAERQAEPDTIAIDDTRAYWTNALAGPSDGVVRAALGEPHALTTLASVATPGPLVVDKTFVYFVGRRDGSIHRVPKGGGLDLVLVRAQPTPPRAIAVDDKRLYFTNGGPKASVLWVGK